MADERIAILMEAQNRVSAPAQAAAQSLRELDQSAAKLSRGTALARAEHEAYAEAAKRAARETAALARAQQEGAAKAAALAKAEHEAYVEASRRQSQADALTARSAQQSELALRGKAMKGREAAGSLTALAAASMAAGGSFSGLANAAGMLTTQFGAMSSSATVAAGAAGVGALITAGVTLAAVWKDANAEFKASEGLMKRLSVMSDESTRRELTRIDRRAEIFKGLAELPGMLGGGGLVGEGVRTWAARELRKLAADREEVQNRVIAIDRRANEQRRDDEKQAADKMADDRRRFFEEDDRRAAESAKLGIERSFDRYKARKLTIDLELDAEKGRVEQAEALSDRERERLLKNIEAVRAARKRAVDEEKETARQAAIFEDYKKRMGEMERDTGAAAARIAAIWESSFEAFTRGGATLAQTLKRMALEPIVAWLEAKAKQHFAQALGDALYGNFAGAAGHAAAAAAATASAREVASWAGVGTRGSGGGGGAAGGGAGSSTFEPRPAGGAGHTWIIQTIDPTSRRVVDEVRYQLDRAEKLNRPIVGGGVRVIAA